MFFCHRSFLKRQFRSNGKHCAGEIPLLFILVTLGLCLSAVVTALGMHYLANWAWISALLFGALIAATDPVSVIATFKESGAHGRFRLLVEAESLLNDGTAAVAYAVILAAASGSSMGTGRHYRKTWH